MTRPLLQFELQRHLIRLSVYLHVCLSICMSVYLSVCLFVYLLQLEIQRQLIRLQHREAERVRAFEQETADMLAEVREMMARSPCHQHCDKQHSNTRCPLASQQSTARPADLDVPTEQLGCMSFYMSAPGGGLEGTGRGTHSAEPTPRLRPASAAKSSKVLDLTTTLSRKLRVPPFLRKQGTHESFSNLGTSERDCSRV